MTNIGILKYVQIYVKKYIHLLNVFQYKYIYILIQDMFMPTNNYEYVCYIPQKNIPKKN